MINSVEVTTLLSVVFTCTKTAHEMGRTRYVYSMTQSTPFGLLSAECVSAHSDSGGDMAVRDGEAYDKLSTAIQKEQAKRLLEGAMSASFGSRIPAI